MTEDEKEVRQKLKDNLEHYARKCLIIRTKSGALAPFIFNKPQLHLHKIVEKQKAETGKVRIIILKGRQEGLSTYVGGRFYHITTHYKGMQAFIMAHDMDASTNLYKMAKRYYEFTPSLVRPEVSTNNSKELIFSSLHSGYKVGTSENKETGRSQTIQLLHASECAFWKNTTDHTTGILQAVPDMIGTEIFYESTANGVGNFFHQEWQKAEAGISDFIPVFIPWFWDTGYHREPSDNFKLDHTEELLQQSYNLTNDQLAWRRAKIVSFSVNGQDGAKRFCQEYPSNPNEAFQLTGEDSYIPSDIVLRARKTVVDKYGPLIMGVDPARMGMDRTSIIFRQGRCAFNLISYTKKTTMEVVGIVYSLIEKYRPSLVCVDIGGLGAGIVDRLVELFDKDLIKGVNAGETPFRQEYFKNKRAEMWATCKSWLEEYPCQIPDSDSLHSDLCGIRYTHTSNSQLLMESKEDMKKRGIRSSDEADALCLTFAYPVQTIIKNKEPSAAVKAIAQDFNNRMRAIERTRN